MNSNLENYVQKEIYMGHPDMSLRQVKDHFERTETQYLPILEGQKFIGIVHECSIRETSDLIDLDQLTAREVMAQSPLMIEVGTSLTKAVQKMRNTQADCALIIDENEQLVGLFTYLDALKVLSMILRTSPAICQEIDGIENFTKIGLALRAV